MLSDSLKALVASILGEPILGRMIIALAICIQIALIVLIVK